MIDRVSVCGRIQGWMTVKSKNRTQRCSLCRRVLLVMASIFWMEISGLVGCAVGGKSVSIDSNSRLPFFGLELQERQRKSAGPPIHSIREEKQSEAWVKPLSLVTAGASFSRLSDIWDRKATPLPTISVPITNPLQESSFSPRMKTEIEFRE